ncbi:MAG: cysteine desulfurase [Candidatus Hydrothermota bacterium]|nr:MAG: cysteine desulfurase [Candidatus Hydrothermae bacterium]
MDVDRIRKDFPILNREINGHKLIYLDNAATSQRPWQVAQAVYDFYTKHNANIHRGLHTLSEEATEMYEEAHRAVKEFINARTWEEIIFTRNTTEAINLVAYSLGVRRFKPGDEIIITMMEHHSNMVPWQMLKDLYGIKLHYIKLRPDGTLDLEHYRSLLSPNTKLVSVAHVSNVLGVINPVKEIIKLAHDVGALVLIDAAQSAPHLKLDVQDIDCDFMAFSGHKMLGPTGIGVLYGKKELLEEMDPFLRGGDMIKQVKIEGASWNDLPWKFEAGTSNIAGGIGLKAAIEYLQNIGMDCIFEHEKALAKYTINKLKEIEEVKLFGPEERIGVISFIVEGISPDLVGIAMNEKGIAIRTGCHCAQPLHEFFGIRGTARASFYLYNTFEEADKFIERLKEIIAQSKKINVI